MQECFDALHLQHLALRHVKLREIFLADLSRSKTASRLVSLHLTVSTTMYLGLGPPDDLMPRFAALEVLDMQSSSTIGHRFTYELEAYTQLPSLRIFSFMPGLGVIDSAGIEILLDSPSFSARLEYLRLSSIGFGPVEFARIANECTSLIGLDLELTLNKNVQVVDEADWRRLQEEGPEIESESETPSLPLEIFLAAPQAFRRRLVHLAFGGRHPRSPAFDLVQQSRQVWRRYPQLAVLQLDAWRHRPNERFDDPEADPWLPKEDLYGDLARHPAPFPYELQHRRPLFPFVRALKLHCSLPLTPAETAPQQLPAFPRAPWDIR